ncbi:MAG: hypothetical protein IKA03_04325, partial [Alphaproteobacteria bacterium]|nr:hypothetical protein [Alphaproteobacteria bacterium]
MQKLLLLNILREAWNYCNQNPKAMGLFVGLNYVVCAAAAWSWKSFWFWPVLIMMYVLWSALFRYYFERKPYVEIYSLFNSMIPSTKILVLSVLVVSAILLLPVGVL